MVKSAVQLLLGALFSGSADVQPRTHPSKTHGSFTLIRSSDGLLPLEVASFLLILLYILFSRSWSNPLVTFRENEIFLNLAKIRQQRSYSRCNLHVIAFEC